LKALQDTLTLQEITLAQRFEGRGRTIDQYIAVPGFNDPNLLDLN
jgi:hypothetical protein